MAEDRFGDLGRRRRTAAARPSASRRRTASAPSRTCRRAPARGAAARQQVRVGRRDRAVHGHRRAAVHHRAAEHGRGAARAPSRGERAARLRRPAGHGQTWRATPTSASGESATTRGRRPGAGLPGPLERGIFNVCELRQQAAGAHLRVRHAAPTASRRSTASSACSDEFPDVNFAVVVLQRREARGGREQIVRGAGGGCPWPSTRDGAVVNLYGVGGVPDHRVLRARAAGSWRPSSGQPHRGRAAGRASAGSRRG